MFDKACNILDRIANRIADACSGEGFHRVAKALTHGPLEVGMIRPLLVRKESVTKRSKGISIRIAFLSDLHLHPRSKKIVLAQVEAALAENEYDALLMGGDLVDSEECLSDLSEFIEIQSHRCTLAAIPGNHDEAIGVSKVRQAVIDSGGAWIPDAPVNVRVDGAVLRVCDISHPQPESEIFSVLLVHNPEQLSKLPSISHGLVLSGHIHGGQVVWFTVHDRLYPGGFAYRWNVLRTTKDSATVIVSRGVVDLIPIRWRCPREIVICELRL